MTNFIFKSANRLIKNESDKYADLMNQFEVIKKQNRAFRDDLRDIKVQIQKLLIDKHLQHQVDEYFEDNPQPPSKEDLD